MAAFQSNPNTQATEMDVISSIVQDELVFAAKLRPTVKDMSSMAEKGINEIKLPRYNQAGAFAPAAQPADGTAVATQSLTFAVDSIPLDLYRSISYEVPDQVSRQTVIPLEAELAKSAGMAMGRDIDNEIIAKLRLAADGTGGLPDHIIQFSGTDAQANANQAITLSDITLARRLLNEANVPDDGRRFLVVSPKQEAEMLNIDNFRSADKYGAREALIEGEIGKVYGFRVIVHNGLSENEAFAYHMDAVALAVQKEVLFETRRAQLSKQLTEYSFSVGWGLTTLEQGVKQVYLNATGA